MKNQTSPAIVVNNVAKKFEIYSLPRQRLKQIVSDQINSLLRIPFGNESKAAKFFERTYHQAYWALKNINFSVEPGETVGIIGRNGAGKSTLLQIICGTLAPTHGSVTVNGRITAILELGSGFNPEFTGKENVILNARVIGMSDDEINNKYEEIINFAAIGDFVDQPVKTYSSGMLMRLAFATQAALEPKLLVVDEALAVGDAEFQSRCFARLNELKRQGTTILFVSHSIATIKSFCDRALYLRHGEQVSFGGVMEVCAEYERDIRAMQEAPLATRPPSVTADETKVAVLEEQQVVQDLLHAMKEFDQRVDPARQGTRSLEFKSAVLYNEHQQITTSFRPNERVSAYFILRTNRDFHGDIHIGLSIQDKCGTTVMGIRDSNFTTSLKLKENTWLACKTSFQIPLRADNYYITAGLLLFNPGEKYLDNIINHKNSELADLIDQILYMQVGNLSRHPIPFPVLQESPLEIRQISDPTHIQISPAP